MVTNKSFESTLNNLVDELLNDVPGIWQKDFNRAGRKSRVPVNVIEMEGAYQLQLAAPGFEKSSFTIHLEKGMLTITGMPEDKMGEDFKGRYSRHEFEPAGFKRSFTIDEKIDATKIEASYVNGVLTLNLPKKEEVKSAPRSIDIK